MFKEFFLEEVDDLLSQFEKLTVKLDAAALRYQAQVQDAEAALASAKANQAKAEKASANVKQLISG